MHVNYMSIFKNFILSMFSTHCLLENMLVSFTKWHSRNAQTGLDQDTSLPTLLGNVEMVRSVYFR